jgi:hypothetical protein
MNSNNAQVIEVKGVVNSTPEEVWACLTNIQAWNEWWSGEHLNKVAPSWQKDAKLYWGRGTPSNICEFIPNSILDWGDVNIGIETHYYFKLKRKSIGSIFKRSVGTEIVHGFLVRGAQQIRQPQYSNIRNDLEHDLNRFKRIAEEFVPDPQESTTLASEQEGEKVELDDGTEVNMSDIFQAMDEQLDKMFAEFDEEDDDEGDHP